MATDPRVIFSPGGKRGNFQDWRLIERSTRNLRLTTGGILLRNKAVGLFTEPPSISAASGFHRPAHSAH